MCGVRFIARRSLTMSSTTCTGKGVVSSRNERGGVQKFRTCRSSVPSRIPKGSNRFNFYVPRVQAAQEVSLPARGFAWAPAQATASTRTVATKSNCPIRMMGAAAWCFRSSKVVDQRLGKRRSLRSDRYERLEPNEWQKRPHASRVAPSSDFSSERPRRIFVFGSEPLTNSEIRALKPLLRRNRSSHVYKDTNCV